MILKAKIIQIIEEKILCKQKEFNYFLLFVTKIIKIFKIWKSK